MTAKLVGIAMTKVAVVGVGNCASSLVQAVEADRKGRLDSGVAFELVAQYRIGDIEFVAAFDVDSRKIGVSLGKAIQAPPNCTSTYIEVESFDTKVSPGRLLDGVLPELTEDVHIDPVCQDITIESVVKVLKENKCQIVISYLPVGAQKASEFYAEAALVAGASFINCTPARIATNEIWRSRFQEAGVALLGDDIKSQFGSTAIHRSLINLLVRKGLKIHDTFQINIGGNTDFKNMSIGERASQKKYTKENSLKALLDEKTQISVSPSSYIPPLRDFKNGYLTIRGEGLLGMPFSLELKLSVEDSPNSAGVAVNAIRFCQLAMDRRLSGCIDEVCPYLFKHAFSPYSEEDALNCVERFMHGSTNDTH